MRAARRVPTMRGRREVQDAGGKIRAIHSSTKTTVGDIIAAAYDVVGHVQEVAAIVSSPWMTRAIHRRVVIV